MQQQRKSSSSLPRCTCAAVVSSSFRHLRQGIVIPHSRRPGSPGAPIGRRDRGERGSLRAISTERHHWRVSISRSARPRDRTALYSAVLFFLYSAFRSPEDHYSPPLHGLLTQILGISLTVEAPWVMPALSRPRRRPGPRSEKRRLSTRHQRGRSLCLLPGSGYVVPTPWSLSIAPCDAAPPRDMGSPALDLVC